MHLVQVREDGIGLRDFFRGRLLATFRKRNPKSFIFVVSVWIVGNSSLEYPLRAINCRRTVATESRQYKRVVRNVPSVWHCS